MILKSITFSDESTTDNDVLESVQVHIRNRERTFLYDLAERDDWDDLTPYTADIRRGIRETLASIDSDLTITLTAQQALFLTLVTGRQSPQSIEALWPGRYRDSSAVYDCLAFGVFGRIWGGTDGARAEVFG